MKKVKELIKKVIRKQQEFLNQLQLQPELILFKALNN